MSCFTIMAGFFIFLIIIILGASAFMISLVSKYTRELPAFEQLQIPMPKEKTKIFASGGEVIAELYFENREYATYREIPDNVKLAFIAIEDERFYKHKGVDIEGLARAMYLFIKSGGKVKHGASTITQQLARHIFLQRYMEEGSGRFETSFIRKLKEWILAYSLEKKYAKEEILTHYMNLIYYGHSAHGIKTAAKIFFDKKLEDVTLAEAALLAAVPNAPSHYSPYTNPRNCLIRRNTVLEKMLELHFITEGQYETAVNEPIKVAPLKGPAHENYKAPYFVTYVIERLQDPAFRFNITSQELFSEGFRIYTTLDLKMNRDAEKAIDYGMKLVDERKANVTQAAIVALEPPTGRITAMVGGVDFKNSKFNRAWQAMRQPGSSFKPFVYMTAIKEGYPMESTLLDEEVCFEAIPEQYCPTNYDGQYKGRMTFYDALRLSRNVPAVKVGMLVGPQNVLKTARDFGITSELNPYPSISLGAFEVSVLELATAYSTIANGGRYVPPTAIERITDSKGIVLYEKNYKPGRKVVDDNVIARIVPVLQAVIRAGTGTRARIGRPAAGKTGTTNDYRDAWFVGFTPQLTAAVWFGNDDNSEMRNLINGKYVKGRGYGVTGGSIPAPTWGNFMKAALEGKEVRDFKLPKRKPMTVYELDPVEATGTMFFNEDGTFRNDTENRPYIVEPQPMDFSSDRETSDTGSNEELQFIEPDVLDGSETENRELF